MKITEIGLIAFTYRSKLVYDAEGHIHPGGEHEAQQSLVRIKTDEGVDGYAVGAGLLRGAPGGTKPGGELSTGAFVLPEPVQKVLLGEDPLNRERIWQRLRRLQRLYRSALPDSTLSVIDLALWDLAGQMAGLPAYKLMGGYRDRVPAYASTMCGDEVAGGLDTPEAYADFAESCVAQGYRAFKLHTWMPPLGPEPKRDVAACEAVRNRVGPDIDLMLDCYHDYSRTEALYIGRALEDLEYHWFEEPMNESSMASYIWLSGQLNIPIVGPETAGGLFYNRAEWIVNRASDISRYDVALGGLTALMKCVHLCEAHGVALEVHGGGHGNLQALGAMGIPGEYYERGLLHPHFDYESSQPWLKQRPDGIDKDGCVRIPQLPGLGWDFDWDFIERHRIG
jgi:L-alanine-DL-glutamate epimerase-like enolase superfamily enzyme